MDKNDKMDAFRVILDLLAKGYIEVKNDDAIIKIAEDLGYSRDRALSMLDVAKSKWEKLMIEQALLKWKIEKEQRRGSDGLFMRVVTYIRRRWVKRELMNELRKLEEEIKKINGFRS